MSEYEIALTEYTKKTWSKSALLGVFIGLAVIVPGISGSTVAIIFKLYDQFLYAIGNLFKDFKRCFKFLLPIGLGVVVGLIAGFLGVKALLDLLPFAVVCLFAGLMIGSSPALVVELKGAKITPLRIALFALGVVIPVALGVFSAWRLSRTPMPLSTSPTVDFNGFTSLSWRTLLCLPVGYLLAVTQIVPGLSASALLMSLGWFSDLMNSVSLTFWLKYPIVFLSYISLGVGFLTGLFTFSKVLTYLFKKARHTAYSMIVGLSFGSILSMFFNADIILVYVDWQANGVPALDLWLGIGLLAIGVALSYALVRYELKKSKQDEGLDDD
jgi:putative membrane protein